MISMNILWSKHPFITKGKCSNFLCYRKVEVIYDNVLYVYSWFFWKETQKNPHEQFL